MSNSVLTPINQIMKAKTLTKIVAIALASPILLGMSAMVQAQTPGGVTGFTLDLWVDGNNSTNTSWPNLAPAAHSLQRFGTNAPIVRDSRFNFHREIFFGNAASSKLRTAANYSLPTGQVFHAFVVSQNDGGEAILLSFNPITSDANARRTSLRWESSSSIRANWLNVTPAANTANTITGTSSFGIVSMGIMNTTNSTNFVAMNGAIRTGVMSTTQNLVPGVPLLIGNGNNNTGTGNNLGLNGSIQEIILMRGNARMSDNDIQRIHSYLAIKYGLTLNNNLNILDSDANTVWNITTNAGFNNHIFGIARDDATRLNQVQSRHTNSPDLTLFRGSRVETLNSSNTAPAFTTDRTYLMFGSNNQSLNANVDYLHLEGTSFANMPAIDFRLNYRTALVYRAQVTVAGVSSSQTTNMQVNCGRVRFVIVSQDPGFSPALTRIYPINDRIAMGVLINNGDHVSFAGFDPRPGGVTAHTVAVWIDGNSSTDESWPALSLATHTVGVVGASVPTPIIRNSRFNFHQEIFFGNHVAAGLRTVENFNLLAGANAQAVHAFVVSENNGGEGILLAFNPTTTDANARRSSMRWINNNTTRVNWGGDPVANNMGGANFGISGMSLVNNNSTGLNIRTFNGVRGVFTSSGTGTIDRRIMIGQGNEANSTANNLGLNGSIQEIIVMRGTTRMTDNEIQRIQSYLAIKYGITLNAGSNAAAHNYLASDGTVIRDRVANAGFNHHIFGIGRDVVSGLDQRQSRSSNAQQVLTIFLGDELTTLNSQNTGRLGDMQFLTIGSDNTPVLQQLDNFNNADYGIDPNAAINIRSATYKAQLTGLSTITVRGVNTVQGFRYVLVSSDANFTPANTNVYAVNGDGIFEITLSNTHRYIRFIGLSPGPGGITQGLVMWLRASDRFSLNVEYVPTPATAADANLGGLPVQYIRGRETIPTVTRWEDFARGHVYEYMPTGHSSGVNMRRPIYEASHPEMNFQPSVRFWNQTTVAGLSGVNNRNVFLSNPNPVISHSDGRPDHTAMFVTSGSFGSGGRSNMMMFRSANVEIATGGNFNAPAFQIQRLEGTRPPEAGGGTWTGREGAARYRWRGGTTASGGDGGATYRNIEMFRVGATSLASFYIRPSGTNNNQIRVRFNAQQHADGWPSGTANTIDFRRGSILGSANVGNANPAGLSMDGLLSEVILFDRVLNKDEITRLETYLAIKYGLTLRPNRLHQSQDDIFSVGSNHPTNRFNYTLSDGTIIWEGNVPDANHLFARFYNNIAGVVRDDAANINLRQSHSTDVNSIMYMGVAGTKLTDCGSYLDFLDNNLETIIWGGTNFGSPTEMRLGNNRGLILMTDDPCGDFEFMFSRMWYVRKHSPTGRPLEMLVSPRNNQNLTFGADAVIDDHTRNYYSLLHGGNDLVMLVADTYQDMIDRNFTAVIPMTWIEGQHQARYTFTRPGTFVTFGFRTNGRGCYASSPEDEFTGLKRFDWSQWQNDAQVDRAPATGLTFSRGSTVVSDIVTVTGTSVRYEGGTAAISPTSNSVSSVRGFPRASNLPEAGSLEIRRRGGQPTIVPGQNLSDVVTTINFNVPVIPEFTISGLDARNGFREEVEIRGRCAATGTQLFLPTLSYMTFPGEARFDINGSVATVNRTGSVSATDRAGMVHVAFNGAITEVEIRFRSQGTRSTAEQGIFISPITLRSVSPPPLVNENGMSFVKEVRDTSTTTCDLVEYSFFVGNTNCRYMYVSLRDTLPEGLVWRAIAFDNFNAERMEDSLIEVNNFVGGRVLAIDSLLVPPTSIIRLRATAEFIPNAAGGTYRNRAFISYYIRGEDDRLGQMPSFDRATQDDYVSFHAEFVEPLVKEITKEVTANPATFREFGEIEFTIVLSNPSATSVSESYMDFSFNEHFRLVANSVTVTNEGTPLAHGVVLSSFEGTVPPPFFSIAGDDNGSTGFVLLPGETTITFRLQAPALGLLAVDEETERIRPLELTHSFFSTYADPCAHSVMPDGGTLIVPYATITHIRTNRDRTTRFLRRR